jgi:hypothetical protein
MSRTRSHNGHRRHSNDSSTTTTAATTIDSRRTSSMVGTRPAVATLFEGGSGEEDSSEDERHAKPDRRHSSFSRGDSR